MAEKTQNEALMLFGLRLRDIRLQFGFTLRQLAAQLGVGPAHLSNIECGRREPSFALLAAIGLRLSVSLDYLVLGRWDASHPTAIILRSDEELLAAMIAAPRPIKSDDDAP